MGKKKGYEVSEVESNQAVDVGTVIFTPQDYDAIINPKCHLTVEQSATKVESISGSVQSNLNGIKEEKDEHKLEKTSRTELADKLDTKVTMEEVRVESCQEPPKKKSQGKWPKTKIVKYLVIAVAVVSILVLISVMIPGRKKQKSIQRETPLTISILAITDRNGTTIFKKEEVTNIARKPIRYFIPDVDEVPTNETSNGSSEDFGSDDTSQTDPVLSETYTPSSELTTQQEDEFATTFNETDKEYIEDDDSSSDPSTSSTILNLKEPNSTVLVTEHQTPSTAPTELAPDLDEHSTVVSVSTPTLVSSIDGQTTIDDEDTTTSNDGETTVDDRVTTSMPIKETTLSREGSGEMEDSDYSF